MDKNDKKIKKEEKKESKEEVAHLKQKIEELENSAKRILADYQNLEKRVAEEKKTLILNSNRQLLLRLLPVLDTLILALSHNKDKGLELSVRQFLDVLQVEGVKKIDTLDKMFDPKLMECVEVTEGEEGKVISEVLPGYLLYDEVLRPAKVEVGSAKQNLKEEDSGEDMLKSDDSWNEDHDFQN